MGMPSETTPIKYPPIVTAYQQRYQNMGSLDYRRQLIKFAEEILHDPIKSLDWKNLLDWEHKHFKYTKGKLPKPRAEMPIDIISQGKGRCGEFALLYNGLLLANGYQARLVVDCSTLQDKSKKVAGDHVWAEILLDGQWVHVDPTEKRISQPLMYASEWDKDVNLVYALTENEIVNVTKQYQVEG